MNGSRWWTWALTAAGVLQIGMAIAHFGLQYEWQGVDGGELLVGGLTVYAGRLDPRVSSVRVLVLIVAVFWTVHGIYMVVEPMPVPPRLTWIRGPIVAFPATLILLQGVALVSTRRSASAALTSPA